MARANATTHQDLAQIIAVLSLREHCGEVVVRHGLQEDRVLLRSGLVCGARVAGCFLPLGQILMRQGLLTRQNLRASLERMAVSERLQGQLLTEMGLVSQVTVERALRSQLRRRVLHLLALRRVSIEVLATNSATWPPLPPLEPLEIICEHVRALNPAELLAQVGQLRSRVRMSRRLGRLMVALNRVEIEQLPRLEGAFTPAAVARVGDLPLARVTLIAHRLGLLRRAEPGQLPATADPTALRRAYLRLARRLHPDSHPGASDARRAELGRRLAAVNAAYDRARQGSC